MKSVIQSQNQKRALIAAAGTGGHIFPALVIAEGLKRQGWHVVWLGTKIGMENRIIANQEIPFESIEFNGVRGKGAVAWLKMPFKLVKATYECCQIIVRNKADVVIGFGGYVSLPAGLAAKICVKKLLIHEQNSIAGLSNRILSHLTRHVFTAFPKVIRNAIFAGNPLRAEFANTQEPSVRFENRTGPLNVLIVGGSLGAKFLNETVPQALKLIPLQSRPTVVHQSGINQFQDLENTYQKLNVSAKVLPFIENTADAFCSADLIICRAGASTVTEIIAVGAAAIFVPLPSAVDDHQTVNAKYLVDKNAAWLRSQFELTPIKLAEDILKIDRQILVEKANNARKMVMPNTIDIMVQACERLIK